MSPLAPGTRIGPHEVVSPLGVGGMGEVYRATDTRLKRQVALKVLPAAVTADPDRLSRFQREAELLASLNHPNIAAIYGIEDDGPVKALVMELVEGPTLADRIAQGPIPVVEALSIAKLIAEALAAAHEQGIIHRDLKPANIKIRADGEVKVLDFGLAKAVEPVAASGMVSISPTITSPALMTSAGMILGTAAYMSPEQASGRLVDRRTDLWAFGVVLFEMLSGHRLFDGDSVSHVIASVLKDEPDWSALPDDLPAGVHRLLKRCLDKDRRRRLSDAATAALECDEAVTSPPGAGAVTGASPMKLSIASLAAGLVVGAVITGVAAWATWPRPTPTPESSRFAIDLPREQVFTRAGRHVLALSPDGMQLVYIANRTLFLHSFRTLESREIKGTANVDPSEPVFSPDGAWIAFWSDGSVKKIPVDGGTAVVLAEADNPLGLSWSGDRILVGQARSVLQVPAEGGAAKAIVSVDQRTGNWIQSPQLIDEGRAVLFTLRADQRDWDTSTIVVQDLASGKRSTLVKGATDGRVLPGGVLLYARASALFAVAFDERRREMSGETVALEHDVMPAIGGFSGASQFAPSVSGAFAYGVDSAADESELVWLTRQGTTLPVGLPPRRYFPAASALALSPDGTRVAARLNGDSRSQYDVWVGDIVRGTFTRLTSSGSATDPVWTPDGRQVCFRTNPNELHCQPADGSAPSRRLFELKDLSTITDISRDGAWLLLSMVGPNGSDVWIAANHAPFEPKPLLTTPFDESGGTLSPDGRWLAYFSGESGSQEIFIRPFPNVADARWQVSTAGGTAPRWSSDGHELYYLATGTGGASLRLTLMAVPITATGTAVGVGAPVAVSTLSTGSRGYDVAPDGRILMNQLTNAASGSLQRIVVVRNWLDDVKARLRR